MKYRIKEQITKVGKHFYTPQYRKFLFWKCWTYSPCVDCVVNVSYNTLQEAIDFLDKQIYEDAEKLGNTVIKTTIFNYP